MPSSCQTLSSTCTAAISVIRLASSICPTVTLQSRCARRRLAFERGQRADAGEEGRPRIRSVQLIQLDALDAERAQARFAGTEQMSRAAVRHPSASRPRQPALGGDARPAIDRRSTARGRGQSGVRCVLPRSSSRQYASAVSSSVTPASNAACSTAVDRARPDRARSTGACIPGRCAGRPQGRTRT